MTHYDIKAINLNLMLPKLPLSFTESNQEIKRVHRRGYLLIDIVLLALTAQKMKFSVKDLFSKCDIWNVTFGNGKLHFLHSSCSLDICFNLVRLGFCTHNKNYGQTCDPHIKKKPLVIRFLFYSYFCLFF